MLTGVPFNTSSVVELRPHGKIRSGCTMPTVEAIRESNRQGRLEMGLTFGIFPRDRIFPGVITLPHSSGLQKKCTPSTRFQTNMHTVVKILVLTTMLLFC